VRIRFVRSGGVAGAALRCDLETEGLPPGEGRQLEALVDQCRFFELPSALQADGTGPDRFQYDISIERGTACRAVRVSDASMPASLRPLVAWLTAAARRPPRT
jgi:hypothetical protein